MAPFLMNAAACLIVILINQGLKRYGGDLSIGAYGIVNRLSFVIIMIVMGLNQGMQPIAGYNYGAKLYKRVSKVLKQTILLGTIVTTGGFLISIFAPRVVVSLFTSDEELIRLSINGLRITLLCFPIVGFQMVTSNFFQSIGMAGRAIFMSLTRQLLFLLPCLLILPHFFELDGVWYSLPTADLLASIVAGFMLYSYFRKQRKVTGNLNT
ncbi:MAG: MATE family efflux transporter, partial [Prevotellaceae bacterium]|jgi:Na+-driven multidrug efflux pump|nr:MATE family efflux transporter [Prevotellaceae bacterium]